MYLIFDLDDTLLTNDKKISKYTKQILSIAQSKNHTIVINSARSFTRIVEACKNIKVDYYIANGGSEIYKQNELIYKDFINNETTNKIIKKINNSNDVITFSIQSDSLYSADMDYPKSNPLATYFDFSHEFPYEASKILVQTNNYALIKEIVDEFHLEVTNYLNSNWYRLSTTSKAKGNRKLYSILNDSNPKSIAFGDDDGDYEMLQDATIGVAMKNSIPMLLEKINIHTEYTNNEDGCAKYIQKLLIEGVL